MKRICLVLCVVLFFALGFSTASASEPEIAAVPVISTVIVNDEPVKFGAYEIDGDVYYKLRDLAFVLCETSKGFEVIWDQAQNNIQLIPETIYTVVGGEMSFSEQTSISQARTTSSIYLNGELLNLTAFNIRGNNYFKLQDIAGHFEIEISSDETTGIISIDSRLREEITVSNAGEFVEAIASDTIIRLKPGTYDFTNYNNYDISGVSNLAIIGPEDDVAEFVNSDRFREILHFSNCTNVRIENVKAGHTPQEYECDAGVFFIENCQNIIINNCYLYGCGSTGTDIRYSDNVWINNTTITDCSLRAVNIWDSANVVFNNCKLVENRSYASAVSLLTYNQKPSNAEFNKCEISGNINLKWALFDIDGNSALVFNDCTISDNTKAAGDNPFLFDLIGTLGYGDHSITLNGCVIKGNVMGSEYNEVPPKYNDCDIEGNIYQARVQN